MVVFKLGSETPVVKIHIPVRHYTSNDEAIVRGLAHYLQHRGRDQYVPKYRRTMHSLL